MFSQYIEEAVIEKLEREGYWDGCRFNVL
jgi:hypothetical protein